jgi:hypothetical protein
MTEPVANMGVDADCVGLWHFDGSLNSHKGVSATFTRASVAYLEDGTEVEAGQPRFEVGKFGKGVLIEEGTTNLAPSGSDDFVTGWSAAPGVTVTITPGQPDPFGGNNAYRIQSSGGTSTVKYTLFVSGRPNPHTDTVSLWIKVLSGNARMGLDSFSNDYASGDWQRMSHSNTSASTNSSLYLGCQSASNNLDILVCQPQIEEGAYMKSYMPPQGTRANEDLTIPRSSVLPSLNAFTIAFRAYPNLTKIGLENIAGTLWARTGFLEIGNYHAVNESNICVWKDNTDGANTIKVNVVNNQVHTPTPKITLTQAEWEEGPMVVLRYDGSRMYLDTFTSVGHQQVSVAGTIDYPVADLIRIGRAGGQYINGIIDELRIDKIARTDEEIAGWYKANAPFYTSEDMKQWPGYMKLETDGLKVYDPNDALRVLVGSWLKDAVRKYGIKIIEGEIHSSNIYGTNFRTGAEGSNTYISLTSNGNFSIILNGETILETYTNVTDGGSLYFYRNNGDMYGRIVRYDDLYPGFTFEGTTYTGGTGPMSIRGSNIYAVGNFYAVGGAKNCLEDTIYGRLAISARESPEVRYIDEGMGTLVNGECRIDVDPIFMECIEPHTPESRWYVNLTPYGKAILYVDEIGDGYFVVKDYNGNANGIEFTWSLSATRKDYALIRFMEVLD